MQRFGNWFKRIFRPARPSVCNDNLPFTAEEFGRLIGSRRSEDMRILAKGLARRSMDRKSSEKA
jgi:hypothetical protein